jgi:hypothetical protein
MEVHPDVSASETTEKPGSAGNTIRGQSPNPQMRRKYISAKQDFIASLPVSFQEI